MLETTIDNRFRLKERVLQQGELDIYDAIDQSFGQSVWVKIWNAPLNQDVEFAENWRGQLISLQSIDDGHLPRIIAFGRTVDGSPYQVEEPPTGTIFRRWVSRRAPLDVNASVELLAAVAQAVAVAHREGIAHGAINPENVYVEEGTEGQPDAYVTHWELGEAVASLRHAGEVIPDRLARYLAPEQTNLKARPVAPTPTTDVYALGVMLYEQLTGTLPTIGEGTTAITQPRRFNPEIPLGVENLLLRALSVDPALRQPNAHSFANGILQALHNPEPAPPLPVPPPTVVVQQRSNFPWRGLSLIALGALVAVIALSFWFRGQTVVPVGLVTPTPSTILGLVSKPYNQAVQEAWAQGYTVTINNFVEDPNGRPGVVVEQCPAAGLPRDTNISTCQQPNRPPLEQDTILVNISPLPAPQVFRLVPDLYGQTEDTARTALTEGGLRVGTIRVAADPLLPAGRIIEQNPRRGLAVAAGTAIDLIISAGPPVGGEGTTPEAPVPTVPPADTSNLPTDNTVLAPPTATNPLAVPPEETAKPATDTPPDLEMGVVLLDEQFNADTTLSWAQEATAQHDGAIRDGFYQMRINEAGHFWKSQPNALFTDFRLASTLTLSGTVGSPDSGAGVVFRAASDQSYYFFEINGAQSFRLRAQANGNWIDIINWIPSDALLPEGFPNTLMVDAVGERVTLYINGQQVAAVDAPSDAIYLSGDVGIAASAGSAPFSVTFDLLQVGQLPS